jgi:desulfoferrodoxin (superoxide reductase-like protein)
MGNITNAQASPSRYHKGIIYTATHPDMWKKKVKSHAPVVEVKDGKATITTNHVMTEKHFIVRHILVTTEGKVLGDKTFFPGVVRKTSSSNRTAGFSNLSTQHSNRRDDCLVASCSN